MMTELEEIMMNEIEELRDEISDLKSKFEAFAEPCAIGHEQLWELVRGLQGLPVPNGVDLRDLV